MPIRDIGTDYTELIMGLEQTDPYVWLFKVSLSDTEDAYLARNIASVSFLSQTWEPFPFDVESSESDGSGEPESARIVVYDVKRTIRSLVRKHDDLLEREVTLYLVNTSIVGTPTDLSGDRNYTYQVFEVQETTFPSQDAIVFSLSGDSVLQFMTPVMPVIRGHCQKAYKGTEHGGCGYSGALPTCDKTKDGANGCRAHDNISRMGAAPGRPAL